MHLADANESGFWTSHAGCPTALSSIRSGIRVDHAIRAAVLQIGTELHTASRKAARDGADSDAIHLSRIRALPASLLLDAVRLTPITQVEHLVPVIKNAGFVADGPEAQNLFCHACRILIDKISQLEEAVLLGSVIRWIQTVLPIDHRPSLNISSVINTDHPPHIENVPEGTLDSLGIAVDGERYKKFWQLQASLQACDVLSSAEAWTACTARIEVVLKAFDGPIQVLALFLAIVRLLLLVVVTQLASHSVNCSLHPEVTAVARACM
jgi:hypothetical protein